MRRGPSPDLLLTTSYWTSIASWVLLAVLLLANHFSWPVVPTAAMFASVACVWLSCTLEAAGLAGYGDGKGFWDWLTPVAMAVAAGFVVYGYAIGDSNLTSSAVLVVFLLSFLPYLLDFMRVGEKHVYVEGRLPDDYIPADPWDALGMGVPKTQPPIVMEKGQDLDDEWAEHLGVATPGSEYLSEDGSLHGIKSKRDLELEAKEYGDVGDECENYGDQTGEEHVADDVPSAYEDEDEQEYVEGRAQYGEPIIDVVQIPR